MIDIAYKKNGCDLTETYKSGWVIFFEPSIDPLFHYARDTLSVLTLEFPTVLEGNIPHFSQRGRVAFWCWCNRTAGGGGKNQSDHLIW